MTSSTVTFAGGPIFDGTELREGHAARFRNGVLDALLPEAQITQDDQIEDLHGDILSPGYADLQVNGGGGVMFNDDPSVHTLTQIASAHRALGATRILPTLITDTAEKTRAAIDAAIKAVQTGVSGIAGLHLEGPHLSVRRKGAHDAALIRPMQQTDLEILIDAAKHLPALMVTLAPESTTLQQVEALKRAGVIVSLGHTDAPFETCLAFSRAGAQCATHLFNAMSQLGSREPGLVGAALSCGSLSAGLIADGIHVHPDTMRIAWAAKRGPGRIFLVSDAMAVAGTSLSKFQLEGRRIRRENGRLTLEDGTLAGADLCLTKAVRVLTEQAEIPVQDALAAATSVPLGMISGKSTGLKPDLSQVIRIAPDLSGVRPVQP
ncbi:N-acetylglucosamine-6-phosphate deacetylase [Ruegeria sp. HKCCD6604]|uniref:N-acetylglucosamine-6-phosphate deacetylase n=1 Tax=Ruegeria sp. HKCCD6604 TaxID=2683000 RepID=UPI0014911AC2|nr:N-acetylglucosamine-6-phosphate deacetylase [Ruegeria sp. HKCCD6604]NOC92470.1 N-acetylglucosamine-6-phosphate deacetylase [Ruegeria sp. HKCCD6604]